MVILGLTGSIGMGKSAAARRFQHNGIAVFDADAVVHALYEGEAVPPIERAFPGTTCKSVVDREKLSKILIADPTRFSELEGIVHPLVRAKEAEFLRTQAALGVDMAVLEIPLLFETGFEAMVDAVVVVSAPADVQAERVLARPSMTPQKLAQLLARQLPDDEKRRLADYIVDTGGTITQTDEQIDRLIATVRGRPGLAFTRHWQ